MKPVHALPILLSCLAALGILIGPSLHAEVPVGQTQRLKSPDRTPEGLSPSDWAGIRAAYEAGRTRPPTLTASAPDSAVQQEVEEAGIPDPLAANPIAQQAYLKASNTGRRDQFGYSVAVSGDTVVVGAPGEDSNATGVNGNPADDSAFASGAAYVFVRSGMMWTQQAYLKASNTGDLDCFGCSVAVSGDTVVVGAFLEDSGTTGVNSTPDEDAPGAGAAYVFVRNGGSWTQQAYLKAHQVNGGDWFGYSVAVSGDTVLVGAHGEASTTTGGDSTPDESAMQSGAAYVFVRSGTTWTQQAYLKAHQVNAFDSFGHSVAVSDDTAVVGAPFEASSTTGVNSTPDESVPQVGAAYVFVRSGTTWTQQAYLKAHQVNMADQFGWSVAVSGDTTVVGAPFEGSSTTGVNSTPNENAGSAGAAYVFVRSGTTWTQQAYLKAHQVNTFDSFGSSVSVSGDKVVVGAHQEASSTTGVNSTPDESATYAGATYVFVRNGGNWTQQAYLKAHQVNKDDNFGYAVAVSGDTVVVGAVNEDSGTTGVNSTPNESVLQGGAAYVFQGITGGAAKAEIVQSGTDFLLSFPGEPGLSYRVQYTTSPGVPQIWNEFTPPAIYTVAPNGVVTHRDVTPSDPQRFYRAVTSP
jgi:hypothetical protein